jgi:hypothetical protein
MRIPHEKGVIKRFLATCEVGSPVAVEAVGNWYWIVDKIEAAGMVPRLVHPRKAKLLMGKVNKTEIPREGRDPGSGKGPLPGGKSKTLRRGGAGSRALKTGRSLAPEGTHEDVPIFGKRWTQDTKTPGEWRRALAPRSFQGGEALYLPASIRCPSRMFRCTPRKDRRPVRCPPPTRRDTSPARA